MKAAIITNGQIGDLNVVRRECDNADIIICADGGAEYAYKCGVEPDYMIGDFDSLNPEILKYFINKNIPIDKYPSEKDFTDTELCIEKAAELQCDEISLVAGLGNRIDHSLGNIGLLHVILDKGIRGYIAGDDFTMYLCRDKIEICGKEGDLVSILPFNGDAAGVTTQNLKYSLKDSILYFGRPIGISNVMVSDRCKIELKSGEIVVVKYSKPKSHRQ